MPTSAASEYPNFYLFLICHTKSILLTINVVKYITINKLYIKIYPILSALLVFKIGFSDVLLVW